MTVMPADRLGLKTKGRIAAGADADLTVFDPARVTDRATFSDPAQYSEGIDYVLVGKIQVVTAGRLVDNVTPGKGVRTLRSSNSHSACPSKSVAPQPVLAYPNKFLDTPKSVWTHPVWGRLQSARGLSPASRPYSTSTIVIEWSEIPAFRSACEYRHDVTRGRRLGVAKAWSNRNPFPCTPPFKMEYQVHSVCPGFQHRHRSVHPISDSARTAPRTHTSFPSRPIDGARIPIAQQQERLVQPGRRRFHQGIPEPRLHRIRRVLLIRPRRHDVHHSHTEAILRQFDISHRA